MENFIEWVFNSFLGPLQVLVQMTLSTINDILYGLDGIDIYDIDINLVLFSDTPILSTNLNNLLFIFFSIFYTVIFIVIVWKIIKKVFVKITRWNKW